MNAATAVHAPLALALALAPVAAEAGGPGAAPPRTENRQALRDRHGHPLAYDPPLHRDAACAPDTWGALRGPLGASAAMAADGAVTTLDGELQALALAAVQRGVERLARAPGDSGSASVVAVAADHLKLRVSPGADLVSLPLPPSVACAGHEVGGLPAATTRFRVGDRLRVALRPGPSGAAATLQPQAALVALDPRTREILALVGGYHQRPGDFNRAVQGRRQAGSTWKPLVYAAVLASGRYSLADRAQDLPRLFGDWRPRNFQDSYRGPLRLRAALAHSSNTVAVGLLADVGAARVAQLAERLGIPAAQVPRDLTQALGTALVSPLQLGAAYAALADTSEGRFLPARLLLPDDAPPASVNAASPVIDPRVAYLVSSALATVIAEGSAVRARELRLPHLHGKTGTTSNGQDAWFVGYHGGLLAVVWVGDDAAASPGAGGDRSADRTGAEAALPIWMDFMKGAAQAGYAPRPLPRPPGLVSVPLPEGGEELVLAPPQLPTPPPPEAPRPTPAATNGP